MKRLLCLLLLFCTIPTLGHGDDQPLYKVDDPAIFENFRRLYLLMDQHKHDGIDSALLPVSRSSADASQFTGYALWTGSASLAGGASINVAPPAVASMFLPEAWALNSASYTLRVDDWVSSFTITNTGTITQRCGWRALGK